jgi:integrase
MPVASGFMLLNEALAVLRDLHKRAPRRPNKRLGLIIFRLSCCCGLRRKEIAGLLFSDLMLSGPRPCITIRADNTKGRPADRRSRQVPLWWDKGTLVDLKAWVEWRTQRGAQPSDRVVCRVNKNRFGEPLTEELLSKRWRTAIKCLGPERVKQLSMHSGRRSFATLSLEAGRSLVEVRDAMGHASIATTSLYLYAIIRDVPDVYVTSQQ